MRAVQSCGGDVIAAAGVAARGRAGGESGGRRAAARHAARTHDARAPAASNGTYVTHAHVVLFYYSSIPRQIETLILLYSNFDWLES